MTLDEALRVTEVMSELEESFYDTKAFRKILFRIYRVTWDGDDYFISLQTHYGLAFRRKITDREKAIRKNPELRVIFEADDWEPIQNWK